MRSNPKHQCEVYPEGRHISGIALDENELVYGAFKGRFFFTPRAVHWLSAKGAERMVWTDVISCSSEHGGGNTYSRLKLIDGSVVMFPIGELGNGWAGRVGQLYHAMVERWRVKVRDERLILEIEDFFSRDIPNDAIAPNWFPDHPGLAEIRSRIQAVSENADVSKTYLVVTDYDEGFPTVQEVVLICVRMPPTSVFDSLRFDYVGPSHRRTVNLMGDIQDGKLLISGIWD